MLEERQKEQTVLNLGISGDSERGIEVLEVVNSDN